MKEEPVDKNLIEDEENVDDTVGLVSNKTKPKAIPERESSCFPICSYLWMVFSILLFFVVFGLFFKTLQDQEIVKKHLYSRNEELKKTVNSLNSIVTALQEKLNNQGKSIEQIGQKVIFSDQEMKEIRKFVTTVNAPGSTPVVVPQKTQIIINSNMTVAFKTREVDFPSKKPTFATDMSYGKFLRFIYPSLYIFQTRMLFQIPEDDLYNENDMSFFLDSEDNFYLTITEKKTSTFSVKSVGLRKGLDAVSVDIPEIKDAKNHQLLKMDERFYITFTGEKGFSLLLSNDDSFKNRTVVLLDDHKNGISHIRNSKSLPIISFYCENEKNLKLITCQDIKCSNVNTVVIDQGGDKHRMEISSLGPVILYQKDKQVKLWVNGATKVLLEEKVDDLSFSMLIDGSLLVAVTKGDKSFITKCSDLVCTSFKWREMKEKEVRLWNGGLIPYYTHSGGMKLCSNIACEK